MVVTDSLSSVTHYNIVIDPSLERTISSSYRRHQRDTSTTWRSQIQKDVQYSVSNHSGINPAATRPSHGRSGEAKLKWLWSQRQISNWTNYSRETDSSHLPSRTSRRTTSPEHKTNNGKRKTNKIPPGDSQMDE